MANFTLDSHVENGRAVIRTHGYLSRSAGEQLEQEVARLLSEEVRLFVVNMRDTDLINSVGISILIGMIEKVREQGGELAFAELTLVNEEIFKIMGLHRHARILREGEAVEA